MFELVKNILFAPLFVVILLLKLWFWFRILRRQLFPLDSIPGPKLAAWTRFWIVKTLASGDSAEKFVKVNDQYGPLARIGPNHLITDDPTTIRRILGVRSGYRRGPWFDSIRIDPNIPNIVSQRDDDEHRALRHKLAASYSGKNLRAMEMIIDEQISDWIDLVRSKWISTADQFISFDIGKRIQFLTVDIITKICLGEELGCVVSDHDKFDLLDTVQRGNKVCQHFSVLLEFNTLLYYLSNIPLLGPAIVPKPSDSSGVGRIMGIIHQAGEKHANQAPGTQDSSMLNAFLENGVPKDQIDAELTIALVAGSDTTSTSVQSTLLAICSNPRVYNALKMEIQIAVNRGLVSEIIQDSEARSLPYLHACVLEGLRKFPPLSQLRERIVPPEGDCILGYHVPGGTYIGINAWGTQLDDVFGPDQEAFRPERWLISDKERLQRMGQTQELIFGYGSTRCLGMPMAMMELRKMIFEVRHAYNSPARHGSPADEEDK
ncbi:hypothetical protein DSL72_002572 [Monilinia vaccinii-corymbosi]|uniref:Pisatin demethylase n=1 Tax=Monilinia vaccinii-corymbosi TaxID=61207 RepID=A0A8A3PD16_9HELO|nr:hypothetical protein DSL72_002572 [Monilinia vaccinii-corymbosi]